MEGAKKKMNVNVAKLGLGGGRLTQLANRTLTQMMSYIIDCPMGGVIVIDGGTKSEEDARGLREEIAKRGDRVAYWFITHAHSDHLGALCYMMEHGMVDFTVERLCFHFPTVEWLSTKEDWKINKQFLDLLEESKIPVVTPSVGDIFSVGGVRVEVISIPVEYDEYPAINPTTMMLLVHFPLRSVLFMGDFDRWAQDTYLRNFDVKKLRCDIVQMAHHGQQGVDRSFYELIRPKHCLYTAPIWLWENNRYRCLDPETKGKGPFTTLETRQWMEELGVEGSYHMGDGDWIFE